MARYNTISTTSTSNGAQTITSPSTGLLTTLTGTAPYTTTIPNPVLYTGQQQSFYNATGGVVTLATPSGNFTGAGASGSANQTVAAGAIITIISDGANYVVQSFPGGSQTASSLTLNGALTANPTNANISLQPTGTGSVTINPGTTGSIANMTGSFTTLSANGATTLTATTISTAYNNGTLVVSGGVGIAGAVFTNSTASIGGTLTVTTGGLNISGSNSLSGVTSITNATAVTLGTAASGALQVTGGVGIGGGVYAAGASQINGVLTLSSNTASTAYNNGSLIVTGGAGISGALYTTGLISTSGNIITTSTTSASGASNNTGALQVAGGAGIAGSLFVGSGSYFSSYLVMGSLVSADPGSNFYSFGNRLGSTTGFQSGVSIGQGSNSYTAPPTNGLLVYGNVGIGTTSPAYPLQVAGTSAADNQIFTPISTTISATAVKTLVYDTTRDSDGGAWRKRTQHTSWYNETLNTSTRGSRQEFPSVAVIVVTTNSVTIYDGDDATMPMWMVFNATNSSANILGWSTGSAVSLSCVAAINGIMVVGANGAAGGGFVEINFLKDRFKIGYQSVSWTFSNNPTIALRNTAPTNLNEGSSGTSGYIILSYIIYDVAMGVLPNATIDPISLLPIPTIAVGTQSGCNIIKNGNTVYNITTANWADCDAVRISGTTLYAQQGFYWWYALDLTTFNYSVTGLADRINTAPFRGITPTTQYQYLFNTAGIFGSPDKYEFVNYVSNGYSAQNNNYLMMNATVPSQANYGMCAYVTNTYNTGWVHGAPIGAWLANTTATTFAYANYVTNGTFDANVNGWIPQASATVTWASTQGVSGGAAAFTSTGGSNIYVTANNITGLTVGQTYNLSFAAKGNGSFVCGVLSLSTASYNGGTTLINFAPSLTTTYQTYDYGFTATQTSYWMNVFTGGNSSNIAYLDNIYVNIADADRSLNGNHLVINGTGITTTQVATGTDLVAYSGFSSTSYFTLPYNTGSSLNFGTGDYSHMAWVNLPTNASGDQLAWQYGDYGSTSGFGLLFLFSGGGSPGGQLYMTNIGNVSAGINMNDGAWHHVCFSRKSGYLNAYLDGRLISVNTDTGNVNASSATSKVLSVGSGISSGIQYPTSAKIALFRVSATAPSADQVAKIYYDERELFQTNAKATIYGTNVVTALGYDPDLNLLHVGTASGRSVFNGLRRISNTTTAVSNSISAANGLVAEN